MSVSQWDFYVGRVSAGSDSRSPLRMITTARLDLSAGSEMVGSQKRVTVSHVFQTSQRSGRTVSYGALVRGERCLTTGADRVISFALR